MRQAGSQRRDTRNICARLRFWCRTTHNDVVDRFRRAGIEAEGVVLTGRPASVVVDEAQRLGADLVVAGSRGHGPIASLVLGSVSAELVDRAHSPVLVVRGDTADRVLFPTDGSPSALDAEKVLTAWPVFEGAAIRVLSVADVPRPWQSGLAPTMVRQVMDAYARDLEDATEQHEALARDASGRMTAAGRTVETTVRTGDAAAEIIDEASAWPADLVVMGSRGLTGLSRFVLGSVARNVLQGSPSSVLVVRHEAGGRA